MIIVSWTLYAIVGVVVGSFAGWDTAKGETQQMYPSVLAPIGAFLACGLIWPLVLVACVVASAGAYLIHLADRGNR